MDNESYGQANRYRISSSPLENTLKQIYIKSFHIFLHLDMNSSFGSVKLRWVFKSFLIETKESLEFNIKKI